MKESYIKLPNITVSKLQDVVDYLDKNNIEYIEEYKRDEEINRLNNIIEELERLLKQELDTIRNDEFFCNLTNEDYIEFVLDKLNKLKGDNK